MVIEDTEKGEELRIKEIGEGDKVGTNKEDINMEDTNKEGTNKEGTNKEDINTEDTNKEGTNMEGTNMEDTNKESTNMEDTKEGEVVEEIGEEVAEEDSIIRIIMNSIITHSHGV